MFQQESARHTMLGVVIKSLGNVVESNIYLACISLAGYFGANETS